MNTPANKTMTVTGLLRWQFQVVHGLLDITADGLSVQNHPADSRARLAVARFALTVVDEDVCVHCALAAGEPLALSTWAGRTGIGELPPLVAPSDWLTWAQRAPIDLPALRAYAKVVYAATDAGLHAWAGTADAMDHRQTIQLLSALLLTLATRRGEIASLVAEQRRPSPFLA